MLTSRYKRDVVRRDAIRTPAALGPSSPQPPRSLTPPLRSLHNDRKAREADPAAREKLQFLLGSPCRLFLFLPVLIVGERCSPNRVQCRFSWSSSSSSSSAVRHFTLQKQRSATITVSNR